MAVRVDNEAWERWPDEVFNETNWGEPAEVVGDYSALSWDEWKKPGQSWAAKHGEDFTDAFDFSEEIWRQAQASKLGINVIVWSWELVIFRFLDYSDRATRMCLLEPVEDDEIFMADEDDVA